MAKVAAMVSLLLEEDKNRLAKVKAEFVWGTHRAVDPSDGKSKVWGYVGRVEGYRRILKNPEFVAITEGFFVDRYARVEIIAPQNVLSGILTNDSLQRMKALNV